MSKASEVYLELEKSAGLIKAIKRLPLYKALKEADSMAATSGKKGLKNLAQYRDPFFDLEKGFQNKPIHVKELGGGAGGFQKFIAREVGNTAHALSKLTDNVSEQKGVFRKAKQGTKNFVQLGVDQMRGALYKEVPKAEAKIIKRHGKEYVQGKGLFKGKFFERQVVGKTDTGDYVIRKRKAMVPLALSTTGPGIGATTLLMGTGNPKKDNPKDRMIDAAAETAAWSVVPAVAQAKMVSDIVTNKE